MTHERPPGTTLVGPDRPGEAAQSPRPVTPPRPRLGPEDWQVTQEIATQLGETDRGPLGQVGRVVGRLGADRARTFLARTQEIEAAGGLMLPDGSRRRTPGGVFFHLVRADDTLSREDRVSIFPPQFGRNGRTRAAGAALTQATPASVTAPAPAAAPSSAWADDDYRRVMAALQQETGRATTVKITVIGRPGAAVEQGQAVAVALVSEKVPDLPKGLPAPPAGTRYTVFAARRHALHRLRRPQTVDESGRGAGRRRRGCGHHRGLRRPRPARGGQRRLRHQRRHQAHAGRQTRGHTMRGLRVFLERDVYATGVLELVRSTCSLPAGRMVQVASPAETCPSQTRAAR